MKKYIPLWVKVPLATLGSEFGRLPIEIVWGNMRLGFVQSRKCSAVAKDKANIKTQHIVCRYLDKKYGQRMTELCASQPRGEQTPNAPIWVFWWQGVADAPYLIGTCVANLQKNAGDHPVYVVDRENYRHYVQIPEHIEKRLQNGEISLTHFSDYLRMKLLAEHGGIWADATVFAKSPMGEAVFQMPFWTVRNPGCDASNISGWEWSINLMGGWKGNGLFRAMAEILECYWAEHKMVANYFMTDCLIRVIYDRCGEIRAMMSEVPPSNEHYYYFLNKFPLPLDLQNYEEELSSETWLYKISWKGHYEEHLPDGRETYYGRWKRDFGAKPQ